MIHSGSAAWCTLDKGPRVQAGPQDGCSAWERIPGVDDEPGPPACPETGREMAVRPFERPRVAVPWAP